MKPGLSVKLLILIVGSIACADKKSVADAISSNLKDIVIATNATVTDTFAVGKVIEHVICQSDAKQSYSLYIPAKDNNESLPIIYFFDPHGDGSLPLKKYKALGKKFNFILIGSNNSKNGNDWPITENIWRNLFRDSQKRLKINPDRIYVCGFSGGAKVAGYVALNHSEIKSVIANGAGLPDEIGPANFNFSLTSIAGEGDMNMTSMVAFNNELDKTQTRHRIIFFDGTHEWAPENIMDIAFAGLQLDAMNEKLIQKDETLMGDYIKKSKERIVKDEVANNLVKAERECKLSISLLDGITNEVNSFIEKKVLITSNKSYQKQWQVQQELYITEQTQKEGYMQQFQNSDINYWIKTINDLHAKAKAPTALGAMNQRLQAYLSLAFYSLSNRFITANQDAEALHFVELYKLADPTNSEARYFSAVLNARKNNVKDAESDLVKAVELGFTDANRIKQQPEFQKLSTSINFSGIESRMKKSK